jgi:hypothetical protein
LKGASQVRFVKLMFKLTSLGDKFKDSVGGAFSLDHVRARRHFCFVCSIPSAI